MTRFHTVLGHVVIGHDQQLAAQAGGDLDMPLAQFRKTITAVARVGDLVWVKESWCIVSPFGVLLPGNFIDITPDRIPEVARKRGYKLKYEPDAKTLRRGDTRFTFEIVGFVTGEGTVRFKVHHQQIDKLLAERSPAA